jgi:hypothetical protein
MPDQPLELYDWQEADVAKITRSIRKPEVGALVVTAPGGGKTVIAVEAMRRLKPAQTLIIAPPSTHVNTWARTIKRQGITAEVRTLIGTKPGRKAYHDLMWGVPGVYLTSSQWFARQDWGSITPDMVIVDEIHMLAKYGNVGQKKLLGHAKKKGLWAPMRIALSGTPFRNSFENAWSVVRWVEPAKISAEYWVWRMRETTGKYSPFAPQNWEVTGEKEPGKLASSLTCYVAHYQRTRCCKYHPNGFLAHLAEPIRVERDLPMTKNQSDFYTAMEKNYIAFLTQPGEDGKVPVVAELPIVARGMLRFCALALPSYNSDTEKLFFREDCESPKIEELIADLAALDGRRALVLTHSKQFVNVVVERLRKAGFKVAAWSGDTSKTNRDKILKAFMSDELDAIVGVISAMGTGTDGLQEAAYNVMWLSIDDDPTNVVQGIGRLDRLGQKHQVTMIEYRMLKTYDVGHLDRQILQQFELNKSLVLT